MWRQQREQLDGTESLRTALAPQGDTVSYLGRVMHVAAWAKQFGIPMKMLYNVDDGFPATAPVGSFPEGSSRFGPVEPRARQAP